MRRVTLRGTEIHTSALGFGTASLMGKLNRRESLTLLDVAYEHGLRHFDTAPLYGYGESESVLGDFLRTHPDATVATKFGLSNSQLTSPGFHRAKFLARPILQLLPSLRRTARRALNARLRPERSFDPAAASKSLSESLQRLRRDYVDLILLHECRPADLGDDRLLTFLSGIRDRGLVRAFGIATDISTVVACLESESPFARVVQYANSYGSSIMPDATLLEGTACITHSPFGGTNDKLRATPSFALTSAVKHNPNGIVLFGSQNTAHIISNASLFS